MSRGLYAACQNGLVEDHSGGFRIEPLGRTLCPALPLLGGGAAVVVGPFIQR